jgi:hypothetical protein
MAHCVVTCRELTCTDCSHVAAGTLLHAPVDVHIVTSTFARPAPATSSVSLACVGELTQYTTTVSAASGSATTAPLEHTQRTAASAPARTVAVMIIVQMVSRTDVEEVQNGKCRRRACADHSAAGQGEAAACTALLSVQGCKVANFHLHAVTGSEYNRTCAPFYHKTLQSELYCTGVSL